MKQSNQNTPTCIIKKSTCPKLSGRAKGTLTYHVGYADRDKSFHLRVTANKGGFFSKEWIALDDIRATIEEKSPDDQFKAIILQGLFHSRSANNHGFLPAALRSEGILNPVDDHPLSHTLGDVKTFKSEMTKLIKAKTDLHDDVAEAERIKEEKRAEMIERMKTAAATKEKPTTDEPKEK
ncbi:MAG: hypothetical protein V7708_17605 [Oceanicoccus sp.]